MRFSGTAVYMCLPALGMDALLGGVLGTIEGSIGTEKSISTTLKLCIAFCNISWMHCDCTVSWVVYIGCLRSKS